MSVKTKNHIVFRIMSADGRTAEVLCGKCGHIGYANNEPAETIIAADHYRKHQAGK